MLDDLHAYFYNSVVLPYTAYAEVRENGIYGQSKDRGAAINAATALYHFREHIPAPLRKSRKQVAGLCPDYDLLGDVVNAAKHSVVTQGTPQISSAEDIYEQTVSTEYEDSGGCYSDFRKLVVVRLKDGSERHLFEVMTNVLNFWGSELKSLGCVKDFKPFALPEAPGSRHLTRTEANPMKVVATQGIKFVQRMQLRKYDPAKGNFEPIDLTGAEVRYRVYRPSYSIDVGWQDDDGREYTCTLDLTKDQSTTWHGLETDEQRREFVNALIVERKDNLAAVVRATIGKEPEQGTPPS